MDNATTTDNNNNNDNNIVTSPSSPLHIETQTTNTSPSLQPIFTTISSNSNNNSNNNNKEGEGNGTNNANQRKRTRDVLIEEDIEFKGLLLSEAVQRGLAEAGYEKPSPIQLKAIPLGKFGVDLIAQAKSGTGKTLVFSVITLESIIPDITSPQALILAPTREIATQIHSVILKLATYIHPPLHCECFIGGITLQHDISHLKQGCQIIVGTPGRINDLIEKDHLPTHTIRLLIFDEVDKLLDDSFLPQIDQIIKALPQRKQILGLSATYTPQMMNILKSYMNHPQFILLSPDCPSLEGVKQYYVYNYLHLHPSLPPPLHHTSSSPSSSSSSSSSTWQIFEEKSNKVKEILSTMMFNQCLIFCNNRDKAQNLSEMLNNEGWPTRCLSGDIDQSLRLEIMNALYHFKLRILISTDLIARGVDIDKVNLVINLDVPRDAETYLHRVGRTGRFGTCGIAITFIHSHDDLNFLENVKSTYQTQIDPLPDVIPKEFYEYHLDLQPPSELPPSLHSDPPRKQTIVNSNHKNNNKSKKIKKKISSSSSSSSSKKKHQFVFT